ncbi:MAG: oxidoreductase [Candidatus Heritagella sp.]
MEQQTWMITGCSAGGIGYGLAAAVLEQGHRAVLAVRDPEKVRGLLVSYPDTAFPVVMDVTNPEAAAAAVQSALDRFGAIDVLVNNAGYCYRSSIEEAAEDGVRQMFETNFFGPVSLIRRVLPSMRARRSGMIINISSIAAVRTHAASGYYAASKAALELMSEALSAELEPLGIRVMIVEPGAFRTHFFDSSLQGSAMTIGDYEATAWTRSVGNSVNHRDQPGDPLRAGRVILQAAGSSPSPSRLLLGSDAVKSVSGTLQQRLAEIGVWEDLSVRTDF